MQIVPLSKTHDRKGFDCGNDQINSFLKKQANQAANNNYSKTFVRVDPKFPKVIIGFFTLTTFLVTADVKKELKVNYPHSVYSTKLARIGVDKNYQGQNHAELMMVDALEKTLLIANTTGSLGLFVDAKNQRLVEYYSKFGFIQIKEHVLWFPVKTIEKLYSV